MTENIRFSVFHALQDKTKKGIYIHGPSGSGKTTMIRNAFLGPRPIAEYICIYYGAADYKSGNYVEDIIHKAVTSTGNVMDAMCGRKRTTVLVLDDIDTLNTGDKQGITALIKRLRMRKGEQLLPTSCRIICIGNGHADKKIKELMKLCHVVQMQQISHIYKIKHATSWMQLLSSDEMAHYTQQLSTIGSFTTSTNTQEGSLELRNTSIPEITSKRITSMMLQHPFTLHDMYTHLHDSDRTSIGLVWHENVIDYVPNDAAYLQQLELLTFADQIDRIAFQFQVTPLQEISNIIKACPTSHLLHKSLSLPIANSTLLNLRFTKSLTKHTTEYNHALFMHHMSNQLGAMDKKDLLGYFQWLRQRPTLEHLVESHGITKAEIKRMYRCLDRLQLHVVSSSKRGSSSASIIEYDDDLV